jgi:acyl phosphate:glycerol-3-phosphate acyltransferase
MTLSFLLSALLGYLLGSIPSAFLMVRWKSRKDIREAGSGNVGALNSYLVTRSRFVGGAVLLLDLLKGMAAVAIAGVLFSGGVADAAVAGGASVVGHNFPVWLGFKGGRGLATAAGVALLLAWPLVPAWVLLWFVGYVLTRNVNVGNAIATLLLIVAALLVPSWVLERIVAGTMVAGGVRLFIVLTFGVILLKHITPVREFVHRRGEPRNLERPDAEKENP